jgi:hypothetical protein
MAGVTWNVTESPAADGPVTVAVIELVVIPFPVMAAGLGVTATLFTVGFTVIDVLAVFPEFDSVPVTVQVPAVGPPVTVTAAVLPLGVAVASKGAGGAVMVHGPETVKCTSSPPIPEFEAPVTVAVTADVAPTGMLFGVGLTDMTSAGSPPWLSTRAGTAVTEPPRASVAETEQKPDVAGAPVERFGLVYVILAWPALLVSTGVAGTVPHVPSGSGEPAVNVTPSALAGVPL